MRQLLTAVLIAGSLAGVSYAATATSTNSAGVQTPASQAAITPDSAVALLRAGNQRFVAGTPLARDLRAQASATAAGQYPFAAVLGCIDSRVAPEVVFDAGVGDLFAARVAGNSFDDALLGSLEFATHVAGARAIVVLGHTKCGAVKGACDGVKLGSLTRTLELLAPAVAKAKDAPGPHTSSNSAFVERVAQENVRLTAKALATRSPILAELQKSGKLRIVPAIYDLETSRVSFLD